MFHEYCNHDIYQHKLGHQDENNEEYWSNERIKATVFQTVCFIRAFVPDGVL